ncbi:MAG: 50S ribosomal protein L3 [Candidatus Omnitrophica bacterium]|nr:50S ribosomal protein L3 [Candidatus Omnitrophota bacterium]
MIGLLGKKIGMTQVFDKEGSVVPVTVVEAGPCPILQIKTKEKEGYTALQLGFGEKKPKKVTKALMTRFTRLNITPKAYIREFRVETTDNLKEGQILTVDLFNTGDYVDVTGTSIGKGFQGGVKRWHWKSGDKTHGSMSHRRPGSIGSSSDPSRVFKGHHLPGRMGGKRLTTQNLEVIKVDKDKNLLIIKGSLPGHDNSIVMVKKALKKKFKVVRELKKPETKKAKETPKKETKPKTKETTKK